MKLCDLKLGTKLGSAFLAIALLTATIGGVSLLKLTEINGSTTELASSWLPSVKVLGEMRTTAAQLGRVEAEHLMAADLPEMDAIEKRRDALRKAFDEQHKSYEAMINSAAEKQMYDKYKVQRDKFLSLGPRLLRLSRGGESVERAKSLFRGELSTTFAAMSDALNDLSELNGKGAASANASAQSTYGEARGWLVGLVIGAVAAAAMLGMLITRRITRPIANAVDATERIAAGDLTVEIFVEGSDEPAQLLAALAGMKDKLQLIVSDVRQNAEGVATASAQIAQGNNDLSGRTEQQASALEETAASMEELGSTVRQNADNARQANQFALGASAVAAQGGAVVGEVVSTMKGINDSSKRIADIISVIDGIAFQTNILALNAAVEAARAGEQGRGFAVVAGEVRNLAQRSADAAKEIKSLITTSVERVDRGVTLVDQAGATMSEVLSSIKKVTEIMAAISEASNEQSAGVAQVGEAVNQMDQATQQNAALVEESAAAAESLKAQAQQLVQAVSVFRTSEHQAMDAPAFAMGSSMAPMSAQPPAHPAVDRRGPNRATNVARMNSKPKAQPAASNDADASAGGKTGTYDEWTSF